MKSNDLGTSNQNRYDPKSLYNNYDNIDINKSVNHVVNNRQKGNNNDLNDKKMHPQNVGSLSSNIINEDSKYTNKYSNLQQDLGRENSNLNTMNSQKYVRNSNSYYPDDDFWYQNRKKKWCDYLLN